MTKVQLTFKLSRSLNDHDLVSISRIHSVYGMFAVRLLSSGEEMFVEYDASRLTPREVRETLAEYGLPILNPTPAQAESERK